MARYAIGDIQGCMTSLERLLARIHFDPARDELWLVGDLVNRGPRSLDVLRWARGLGEAATCVLGNHDLHLLARAAGVVGAKKRDTLDEVLAAPDRDELIEWLRHRPLLHHDDAYALVHAGLHPRWRIDDARGHADELERELRGPGWKAFVAALAGAAPTWHDDLTGPPRWRAILAYLVRVRTCRPDGAIVADFDGPPELAPPGATPWFALADRAWTSHAVVFGHWAAGGLRLGDDHLGLDTGCVWGKALTAICLDDRAVVQVKAAEAAS